ncbi:MAG: hypothetical protein AABX01_01440 [Candidatus Micrarchaeota archaeon]
MKKYFIFGFLLLAILVLAFVSPPSKKVVRLKATAPDDSSFFGFLYADGSFAGKGIIKDAGGKPVQVQLWDMSFSPDEKVVTVCPGVNEDNSFCLQFEYKEGVSKQTVDWLRGPTDFMVEINTFAR